VVLADGSKVRAPVLLLTPEWARIPMVLLATAATVIASQGRSRWPRRRLDWAICPRLRIEHTSASTIGQIYVLWINGVLMVMVLILVFAFRSSEALVYAFGMAVSGIITVVTTVYFYYARTRWGWPLWVVLTLGGFLLLVDLMFFAANLTKLLHGDAWLPLLITTVAFTVMSTWQKGREIITDARGKSRGAAPTLRPENRDPIR
jgi:KUP system potassium uptake protein